MSPRPWKSDCWQKRALFLIEKKRNLWCNLHWSLCNWLQTLSLAFQVWPPRELHCVGGPGVGGRRPVDCGPSNWISFKRGHQLSSHNPQPQSLIVNEHQCQMSISLVQHVAIYKCLVFTLAALQKGNHLLRSTLRISHIMNMMQTRKLHMKLNFFLRVCMVNEILWCTWKNSENIQDLVNWKELMIKKMTWW